MSSRQVTTDRPAHARSFASRSLVCSLAAAIYAGVQADPSPLGALLLSGGPALAVMLWLQKDARRTGVHRRRTRGHTWRTTRVAATMVDRDGRMNGKEAGFRYELVARVIPAGSVKRRRVFTWRNLVRSTPRIADQSGCPLQVLRPRLYSHASIGSRIWTSLRFDVRNISDTTIHSYSWRHASPVQKANGGFGCHPDGGLPPAIRHHESAHLTWRGPITVTIDFVQFRDGEVWLSSDPDSYVTRAGLQAGSERAAEHLLHVFRNGGMASLGDALRCIHRDVDETAGAVRQGGDSPGGFYAGVTRAAVVAGSVADEEIESALLTLSSR